MRYRKKPVVIEAMQWDGTAVGATDIIDWILDANGAGRWVDYMQGAAFISIDTLEGTMKAQTGDWIIQGVQGEFYPCKPDIFEATYEDAE